MTSSDYYMVAIREWRCPICCEVMRPIQQETKALYVLMGAHFYKNPACGKEIQLQESLADADFLFRSAMAYDEVLKNAGINGFAHLWLRNPPLLEEDDCGCICPLGYVH